MSDSRPKRLQPLSFAGASTRNPAAILMMVAIATSAYPALGSDGVLGAQEAPADTIQPLRLAPVEVTVLRTPVSQDASPLAIAVLGETELRQGRSGVFVEEALQGLPGVQVQNRFNPAVGERVMIRGFGARAQFGLRGVRVVVDGIPATIPDGQSSLDHLDLGSLARVEVVRGPASALFGNSAGGVLSFHTRPPASQPVHVDVETVGGSHGLFRAQATASGTVNTTGYLLTASRQSWDGFRPVSQTSARADTVAAYGASERLGFNARITRPMAGGEFSLTANILDLDAENAGSTTNDFRGDPDWDVVDLYLRFRTLKELSQQQAGLRWSGPVGDAWNVDLSTYGILRDVYNPIPSNVVDLSRTAYGARAQLGQSSSNPIGRLDLQGGAEYDVQDDDRRQVFIPFAIGAAAGDVLDPLPQMCPPGVSSPTEVCLRVNQAEDVRNAGVFLQANLILDGGAVVLAGLRYDRQRFQVTDRLPVSEQRPDDSGSRTMDALSPSIGASVPLGDVFTMFGSVSSVFETPTTTELKNQPDRIGGMNPELDPTRGESFELGLRGRIQPRAAFEVTTYQTNLRNELVPFEIADQAGVVFWRNAGSSRHRGVEATLSLADVTGLLRGDLTYTYTDARFQEYLLGAENLRGNRVPGVSPQRVQGIVRVTPASWFTHLVATYVDNVPVNDQNTASAPSYVLLDLRAGLEQFDFGSVRVAPWIGITNLLDEAYIASAAVNAVASRFYEPGPERSFQLGVRASWGGRN